jgi:uncharacterized protein DUF4386
MTRTTNTRVAGIAFLLYIALGIAAMILSRVSDGEGVAAILLGMAQHAPEVRIAAVLNLFCGLAALVLGVSLYALTRAQDRDLALLALTCRVAEGVIGGISVQRSLGLLWLATAAGGDGSRSEATQAIASFLLGGQGWSAIMAGMFFAVGSTLFSWLLLRGRMIPRALAWLGVVASVVLVVGLPLRIADALRGPAALILWLPMAAFEIPLALWLLLKGAVVPQGSPSKVGGAT